ncbi:MAG TPA: flavoprotein [Chloroflexota bacterium]|nr:flavoprotein [Chloroflexota bacterium]
MSYDTLYVVVSGTGTARRMPGLLSQLTSLAPNVLTVLTPNASRVVSPRELALVPGHQIVESYFDAAILPRPPRGVVLFGPCSFNSLNKLAQGIADNLALSIIAEAIGRETPVIVAISVNAPLWAHPRAAESAATLRRWGCHVLDPVPLGDSLTLASDEAIVEATRAALSR